MILKKSSSSSSEFNNNLNNLNNNMNSLNENNKGKFKIFQEQNELPKLILDYHEGSVSTIAFAKASRYFLVSGGSDKTIIVWKIIEENFTSEKIKLIKAQSDITDIVITPNDEYMFSGCVDNNIYVWRCNFYTKQFEQVSCINLHSNYITSICLDPNLEKNLANGDLNLNSIKFASYSEEGRLILGEFEITQNGYKTNVIRDFKEIANTKNKINSIQKKIEYNILYNYYPSWSSDGNFIVSVNHHFIKSHKIVHARLINLNDLSNTQILIGHDNAVLIAVKINFN
jgi:WD40 repeat protein